MLVGLAGSGLASRVVEPESVDLRQSDEEGLAVPLRELAALIFEHPGHEQQVVFGHVEFIEQRTMRRRQVRHKQVGIARKKRIGLRPGASACVFLIPRERLHHPDLEGDAILLDHFHAGREALQRAAPAGVGRPFQQGGLQRARCQK